MTSPLCVDASLVVRLLVHTPESERVQGLWEDWRSADRPLIAPSLLPYEVANALYRYERAGQLLADEVQQALINAQALLGDLRKLLSRLEDDLRERSREIPEVDAELRRGRVLPGPGHGHLGRGGRRAWGGGESAALRRARRRRA